MADFCIADVKCWKVIKKCFQVVLMFFQLRYCCNVSYLIVETLNLWRHIETFSTMLNYEVYIRTTVIMLIELFYEVNSMSPLKIIGTMYMCS